ncbi:MAG: hypothetical protein HQ518_08560 [Rhodopirellula sp.]|nr:hypothetical protein [Rhodopirellula sp.]
MKLLLHKAMTILLSGAVLASSVLPPAVCHAHSDGDRSHSHQQDHVPPNSDEHDHGHGHHHDGAAVSRHDEHRHEQSAHEDESAAGGIELAAGHLHFVIAGFDFSLPLSLPGDEGSDGPLSPTGDNAGGFRIVRLTGDAATVPRIELSDVIDLSTLAPLATSSLVDQTLQTARWLCVRAVDRTLLCDSARCERSGVLLV